MSDTSAATVSQHIPPKVRSGPMSRGLAFAVVTVMLVVFSVAASAPSPLYVVYQKEWGFTSTTLTVVFAVYVVGMLLAMLMIGGLSDHVGRRPVLLAAIVVEIAAMALFIAAGDVAVLVIARIAQGVATGAAMTTLGATLVDFNPQHAPTRAGVVNGSAPVAGIALGALGAGALVQYGPAPTKFVYELLLGVLVIAMLLVAAMPETSGFRPGARASLAPRLGVPARLRVDLLALAPVLMASFALLGLYLSLGPSVAASTFGLTNHLIGGLVVSLLAAAGSVATFVLRTWPVGRVRAVSAGLLVGGTVLTLIGVAVTTVALAGVGTVIAGIGFGGASLAVFGTLARLAAPEERGELFALAYVVGYLAFSIPSVVAGFAATSAGLRPTTVVYAIVVAALSASALALQAMQSRTRRRPAQ